MTNEMTNEMANDYNYFKNDIDPYSHMMKQLDICKAQFEMFRPRGAISHFRKHIDIFKAMYSNHSSSSLDDKLKYTSRLAHLFSNFADLFQQAVDTGMKASRTQHPGYYYYEAAVLTQETRRLSEMISNQVQQPTDPFQINQLLQPVCSTQHMQPIPVSMDPLSMYAAQETAHDLYPPTFDHQVQNHVATSVADSPFPPPPPPPTLEPLPAQPPLSIQLIEPPTITDYTEYITRLLMKARDCFEEWSCVRKQHLLSVMIADEYARIGDVNRAAEIWLSVLILYKQERWTKLSESIISRLKSAYPTQNFEEKDYHENRFSGHMTRFEANKLCDFKFTNSQRMLNSFHRESPVSIKVEMPTIAVCRQQFEVSCTIINSHIEALSFEIELNRSDVFACCGNRSINISIPPGDSHTQEYILYPMSCGKVKMPQILVKANQTLSDGSIQQVCLDHLIGSKLPKTTTIMPRPVKLSAALAARAIPVEELSHANVHPA